MRTHLRAKGLIETRRGGGVGGGGNDVLKIYFYFLYVKYKI